MKIYKSLDAPVIFDFFSYADFIQFGAYEVILMTEGPKLVRDFRFGRIDKIDDD